MGDDLTAALDAFLARHETELIGFRRDLHAHPEPAYAEHRTTRVVADRLAAAGLRPVLLPESTGLYADIGPGEPRVALRADLDALPMDDEKCVPYRSTIRGMCHACGHDAHTAMLVGAGPVPGRAGGVRAAARRCPADLPARRRGRERCQDRHRRRRAGRRRPDLRAALRPEAGRGHARRAGGGDHRGLRQGQGHPRRARRAHRAPAPDRRRGLRAREDRDRGSRGTDPPGGPSGQA